jgi:tRNA threonylcarbamoyladenosine biosynthesis protein TsaB
MRFLGIDTSSSHASVAIVQNRQLITDKICCPDPQSCPNGIQSSRNHSEVLLPLIDATLKAIGYSVHDIAGFAVTTGPGSFTGLRIGLSTIKGLSYGSEIPVAGISTLHACAARIANFNGQVCAVLDARKKELYCALFRWYDGLLERISSDSVMPAEKLMDYLCRMDSREPILVTGDGVKKYGDLLARTLGNRIFLRENESLPTIAGAVALLGEAAFTRGEARCPSSLTPEYVRSPEAQTKARNLA